MSGAARNADFGGSGVAGLTAAYIPRKGGCEVMLYEADDRLGGHAHTHDLPGAGGRVHHVGSGFIVHNARTYPYLLRLFDGLSVRIERVRVSHDHGRRLMTDTWTGRRARFRERERGWVWCVHAHQSETVGGARSWAPPGGRHGRVGRKSLVGYSGKGRHGRRGLWQRQTR